jgi:Ca-activated chloride channel homolog
MKYFITLCLMAALTCCTSTEPVTKKKQADDTAKLEEVVVVGYSSPQRQLQGRVPGVAVGKRARTKVMTATYGRDEEFNTEDYSTITENRFKKASENPLSTFSIDVDGASYSNVRRFLASGRLPPAGSVRIEEMINYFHYDYPQPLNEQPFSINTEMAACPWNEQHKLVMIGLQGKRISTEDLPASNLVFLIDVSGSMEYENKLPLVKSSMKLLVDQLRGMDKVSIVVYAGNAGLVLSPTHGDNKTKIKEAIEGLEAGGSTAGGEGIKLAYDIARQNFIKGANNRVILCTDGDFNVGMSSDAELEKLIEEERKSGVFLTVLGYGMGNYKDNKMQTLADKGNGNHSYIDNINEAKKVLVNEFGGTLFTIAKDVKLQVEFNPAKVQAYRLVGYENRLLNKEDFNNDLKDAGDIGSGHTVTALYELIPVGVKSNFIERTDPLKYQRSNQNLSFGDEIMNVKIRYKSPEGSQSKLLEHPINDNAVAKNKTSDNFRFVSAVAQFGMLLSNSDFKQLSSFRSALQAAKTAKGVDTEGYRNEFLKLIQNAEELMSVAKNEED